MDKSIRRAVCVAVLGCILATTILVSPSSATLTVKGRSYALYVDVPSRGANAVYYCDTGFLPPTGGTLNESATNVSVVDIVTSTSMSVSSDGDECSGDSDYIFGPTTILPGHSAQISFTSLSGRDDDECCTTQGDEPDLVVFTDLMVAGIPVTPAGTFNEVVNLPGIGTLHLNQVYRSADDDCDDDDFEVRALHLVLLSGEEVIVGSSYFESDDECCPVPTEPSTWGKVKAIFSK